MVTYKFKSRTEYLEWCEEKVQKIKTLSIAMNPKAIQEVVKEIDQKLYLTDFQEYYPTVNDLLDNTDPESLKSPIGK